MLQGETKEGTFVEHLEELRFAILRMLFSLILIYPVVFYYSDFLLENTIKYLCPEGLVLRYFSPVEPLLVKLKLSFYLTIFLDAPYLLKKSWGFMVPGLYSKERSYGGLLLFFSWLLFVIGCLFSLIVMFPMIMSFSVSFQTSYLSPAIGIAQFVGLSMMLMLGFGIMFQFPAVVFLLVLSGILSVKVIRSYRAIVVIAIFFISALLTPADVISQFVMAIPTWLLFEVGILAASFVRPRKKELDEVEPEIDCNNEDECEKIYAETFSDKSDKDDG
ncbi:MAG: twin-arginine translocase subunit TatC [Candidatus Rifleibacteriota bacterium]